ncbi:MAG: DUF3224 domain-containing protein [Anaerolineaceae bacterium]|nr:DUF3224 domain-containing protein [Anaerolineaceae bacterium]
MQNTAVGRFEIDMKFKDAADTEIPQIGQASFDKVFSGELIGNSQGQFLSVMTSREDSASYVAIEVFTGELNGRRGSFVFLQLGIMNRGQQQLTYKIVPDSGTDQFIGITGDLTLGEDHHYELHYQFPD